jgi:putative ABC transport system ATP-binding protein
LLRFENVTIKADKNIIIKNASFEIHKNEKAVLSGKSGSGKSTILSAVMGIHIPCSGTIFFNDTPINRQTITHVRRSVAFISQEPVLGCDIVHDSIKLPFTFKVHKAKMPDDKTIMNTLERLKLDEKILKKDTSTISGGEKQRIAIVRALLLGKKVFLVDEITSALDKESKNIVKKIFSDENVTLLSVSHDPEWIDIGTKFINLENGEIKNISSNADILSV